MLRFLGVIGVRDASHRIIHCADINERQKTLMKSFISVC